MYELRLAKQTLGKRKWQAGFGFPETGVALLYGDFGNNKVYGSAIGIVPDVTLNTLSDKPLSVKVKLGIGLAYFTKPFDKQDNPENVYIGSRLANMSVAAIGFQYKLSKKVRLQYAISYYHCSNGHYQVPNVGMNLPGFKAGIKYYPSGKVKTPTTKQSNGEKLPLKFTVSAGAGVHEFAGTLKPVGGPKYRINVFDAGVYKNVNSVLNLKSGICVKYYTDYYNFSVKNDFENNRKINATVVSVYAGNEFLLHKTGVYLQTGLDLYAPFEKEYLQYKNTPLNFSKFMEEFVSSEIGINYYWFDPLTMKTCNPYIGIFIKTNFAMADFIGGHIGIML